MPQPQPSSLPGGRGVSPRQGRREPPEDDQLTEGAPARLVEIVHRIEGEEVLDGPVAVANRLTAPLDAPGPSHLLSGAWLGHALHPLLTDFPLGAWTSATLLDLFGGRRSRPAAQGLVAFGVATAVPTIASGWVEWRRTALPDRRVGVVHAAFNAAATVCYVRSMPPRARGQGFRTAAWAVTGGLLAIAGGYLGGHLSIARKIGSRDIELAEARSSNGSRPGEPALTGPALSEM